jgi:hypothetical protein
MFYQKRGPDLEAGKILPGSGSKGKKAPDLGSGSATLISSSLKKVKSI